MPRAKQARAITVYHPNAFYRIDNTDGSLAMIAALDRTTDYFEVVHETDEAGQMRGDFRRMFASAVSVDPVVTVALTKEADVTRHMQPISFEEAVLLAPDFLARLKAYARLPRRGGGL